MLAPKNAPTYIAKDKLESKPEGKTEEPHMHSKEDMVQVGTKWICTICGWVYDPAEGDESLGIPPGTPFEDLPDDYKCPICEKVIPSVSTTEQGKSRINAAYFPFCSDRCRLIDLGCWLDGDYRVSSEIQQTDAES